MAKSQSKKIGKTIGIYPETKHPSYFKSIGLPLERRLIDTLAKHNWNHRNAPVMIQSFEVSNLKEIRKMTSVFLVQLVDANGTRPYDFVLNPKEKRYSQDLITLKGLKQIATYADAVSPYKEYLVPRIQGKMGQPTPVIKNAHQAGLKVHTWTFRPENEFLPIELQKPGLYGDGVAEIMTFLRAGLDALFTDAPDYGRKAVDDYMKSKYK